MFALKENSCVEVVSVSVSHNRATTLTADRCSREDARGALVHCLSSGVGLALSGIFDASMLSRDRASSIRHRPCVLERVSVLDETARSLRSRGFVERNEASDANGAARKRRFRPLVVKSRDER